MDEIPRRLVELSPFVPEANRWASIARMRDARRPAIAALQSVAVSPDGRIADVASDGAPCET